MTLSEHNSFAQTFIEKTNPQNMEISTMIKDIGKLLSMDQHRISKYDLFIESMGNDFGNISQGKQFYEQMLQLSMTSNTMKYIKKNNIQGNSILLKRYFIKKFGLIHGTKILLDTLKTKKNIIKNIQEIENILQYYDIKENQKNLSILKIIKTMIGMYLYKIVDLSKSYSYYSDLSNRNKIEIIETLLNHEKLAFAFGSFYIIDDLLDGDIVIDSNEKKYIFEFISNGIKGKDVELIHIPEQYKLTQYLKKQFIILQKIYPYLSHLDKRNNLHNFFQAQLHDSQLTYESTIAEVQLSNCIKATLTRVCVKEFSTGKNCNSEEIAGFIKEGAINQASNDFRSCLIDNNRTIFTNAKQGFSIFLQYLLIYYETCKDKELAGTYIKRKLIDYIHYASKQPGGEALINLLLNEDDRNQIDSIKNKIGFHKDEKFHIIHKIYKTIMRK